jgi:hypothetical protein
MLPGGATRRTYSERPHHEPQDPSGPRERPRDDTCHATCFVVKFWLGLCPGRIKGEKEEDEVIQALEEH